MSPPVGGLALLAPASGRFLGDPVAAALGRPLTPLEEREFEDGEHKSRPLGSVRGRDVYVVESLCGDARRSVDEKLVRLLFLLGTLKDHGATRLTAVVPYLCYARKDRRTKPRDPITTRYLAALFESVGVDRMVTVDVHNPAAYENAFRIPAENLEGKVLLVEWAAGLPGRLAVVSPDVGGVKRAEAFRESLALRLAQPVPGGFMEKRRSAGRLTGDRLVGEVVGCTVLLVDDLIATGSTLLRAAQACRSAGAERVIGIATHGAFTSEAGSVLQSEALDRIAVTNTVPADRLAKALRHKVSVLDISGFVAEAIRRLNENGSLVDLMQGTWAR